ncbi:MAG: PL29 family lyase N-terminal domain-containing protein [Bacteroidia bacterium]|nr:PL29 family lyase N-terminal domain-containing protein [Bacteroidia bacterium]
MKKIFRMAVVCALAGAALLYTGCTKDYSDDINDLKTRVSTVESTVASLQAAINAGAVITNVQKTSAGDGYVITTSDGKSYTITNGKDGAKGDKGDKGDTGAAGKDGSVVTISTDGYWEIDGVKQDTKAQIDQITLDENGYICIDGVSTGVKVGTVAIWDQTAGTVTFKGLNADGSDLVIGVCELQSIVFVPQIYLNGVEAVRYEYLGGYYYKAVAASADDPIGYDDSGAAAVLTKGGKHAWTPAVTTAGVARTFALGEIAEAEYHVNPNSFDLASADFTLEPSDKDEYFRSEGLDWDVELKSIAKNKDGKLAVVKYQIENPDKATVPYTWIPVGYKPLSVMRLNGVVKNGEKNVSSDYEAIAPFREELKALAFTGASKYVTNYATAYALFPCALPTPLDVTELYETSSQAVWQPFSVDVQYQTPVDLAKIINVHVYPFDDDLHTPDMTEEQVVSVEDLQKKYPEMKLSFSLVPYKLGSHTTEEQMYGQIEGTTFYPCWVESDGKTQHRNDQSDPLSGISSVGRQPVVLATLTYNDEVVLYGYFKIKITKDTSFRKDFVIKSFPAVPYLCDTDVYTTWAEASHIVLEKELGMTYADFIAKYGSACDHKTYIKKDGNFLEVPSTGVKDYGKFTYTPDGTGTTINDKYKITFTKTQLDNVIDDFKDRTITLYTKFGSASDFVYIGLTVTIDVPAVVTFIQHNPAYWFKAAGDTDTDLVFVNPLVPNKTTDDVKVYANLLDNYWVNNRVKVDLDEAASPAYKDVWTSMTVKYHYELNKAQTCKVDGKELVVKKAVGTATEDELYLGTVHVDNILATVDVQNVRENSTSDNIGTALVPDAGKVTYVWAPGATVAKEVLNMYAHPVITTGAELSEKLADLLYADVQLVGTYDLCDIPTTVEDFHVGFFRPVDIIKNEMEPLKDAVPTGDNVVVGELFRAKDWQNYDIFTFNKTTGLYEECWYETAVNWYEYYGFQTLTVDVDAVKSDQTGKKEYLHDYTIGTTTYEGVNNAARVWIADKAAPGTAVSPIISIAAGAATLGDYVFHYENNTGVVQNFHLYLPIAIEYWWGVVKAEIEIPVTATVAPTPAP